MLTSREILGRSSNVVKFDPDMRHPQGKISYGSDTYNQVARHRTISTGHYLCSYNQCLQLV